MPEITFNTPAGQPAQRELLVLCVNTGTSQVPVWSPIGKRVEDSSAEFDWGSEQKVDIFGITYSKLKKPVITQSFEPCEIDAADAAQQRIWNDSIRNQDVGAMVSYDCLLVHLYAGTEGTAAFAERYGSCAIVPTSLGGEGGSSLGMPVDVTLGGERTTGTVAVSGGTYTFTADS